MIGGRTRVYAILGDPIGHSMSPAIHNAAFQALGIDAVYVAVRVAASEAPGVLRALALAGGGGNVTVPHKRVAASLVEPIDGLPIGGCNTFWGEGPRIVGASTDEIGIQRGWEALGRPAGDWLILGTGGSARAAAMVAGSVGAGFLVRSRDPARAAGLGAEMVSLGARPGDPEAVGLVVNCTPLGLGATDPLPLAVDRLPPSAAGLDLVYGSQGTAWVRALRATGRQAIDGRTVLLGQGAAAFEYWFPGTRAPLEVMGAALDRALR